MQYLIGAFDYNILMVVRKAFLYLRKKLFAPDLQSDVEANS